MKTGFLVEQCMHALFECPDDVNERTNYLTKAVSGEFCVISLCLQKKDLRGYVTFRELISEISLYFQIISVHLSLPLFNFTQWKDRCASCSFTTKNLTHRMCQVSLVVKYILYIRMLKNIKGYKSKQQC